MSDIRALQYPLKEGWITNRDTLPVGAESFPLKVPGPFTSAGDQNIAEHIGDCVIQKSLWRMLL